MSQPPGFAGSSPEGPGGEPTQPRPAQPGGDPELAEGWDTRDGDAEEARQRRRRTTMIAVAAAIALVLVVTGALLFRNYQNQVSAQRAAEEARIVAADRQAELTRQEGAAAGAVQGYLDALASSDAEKALTFAAAEPEGDNTLLSRDALMEANKRAALTGAEVNGTTLTEDSPGVWTSGTVQATYSIGDQAQTVDLPIRRVGEDWKLDRVSAPVKLGLEGPERLVNGVTVPPGAYNLFPGSYSVTSANPLISLGEPDYLLASPVDPETEWEPVPVLSEEGRNRSIEAAKGALNQCLQSKELAPPACPFIHWQQGDLEIDTSTINYTVTNDPWENINFDFSPGTMTATATVTVNHRIEGQATRGGVRGTLEPGEQSAPAYITVKLGSGTPEATFT